MPVAGTWIDWLTSAGVAGVVRVVAAGTERAREAVTRFSLENASTPALGVPLASALARDRPNPPAPRAGCTSRIADRGRCELRGLEAFQRGIALTCAAAGVATSHRSVRRSN